MLNGLPILNNTSSVRDPVCGMQVNPDTAADKHQYNGTDYYFCCSHCKQKFAQSPEKFLSGKSETTDGQSCCHGANPSGVSPSISAKYFCPMCPGVESSVPSDCPVCGMALERNPLWSGDDDAEDPVLQSMTQRLIFGALLALPVFLLAMSHLIPSQRLQQLAESDWSRWLQLILATPVVVWAGGPFFKRGWRSLQTGSLNMFTLIMLGVAAPMATA